MPASDGFFRDLKKVHVVFAWSALALFGATIWMMAVDHIEEWHGVQKTQYRLEAERLRLSTEAIATREFRDEEGQLLEQIKSADEELKNQIAAQEATAKANELARQVDLSSRAARAVRAERDKERADYDLAVRDELSPDELDKELQEFNVKQAEVDSLELDLQVKEAAYGVAKSALEVITRQRDELKARQTKLLADIELLRKAELKIEPTNPLSRAKRRIMEWPIIDGFNSHLKIHQDWLPDLPITLGMTETARFDRCRTCHLSIDRIEAGNRPTFPHGDPGSSDVLDWIRQNKYPHPHSTHPRPDVYLTAASPHPVATFGCTICHEGQGSGTEFSTAAHLPDDPHQAHEWEQHHDFATNHFWEYPMLPKRFQGAACIKCHHSVVELGVNPQFGATAPKVHEGFELIKQYGCFGCHEINGYEAGVSIGPDIRLEPTTEADKEKFATDPALVAGKMRQVGPSLRHIASKTTSEWIAYWTEEPKRFRPTTRMPQFFHLTNQQDDDAKKFMPLQLLGTAQYLADRSEPLELDEPAAGYEPNIENGRDLFSKKGCLACHSHKEFPGIDADFGPDLSRTYAKIKPGPEGFRWLYTWLRNPQSHHPRTKMPILFLDAVDDAGTPIDPAADIAAFLLEPDASDQSLDFSHDQQTDYDPVALDELVRLFLTNAKVLSKAQINTFFDSRGYPLPIEQIKGDEIEFFSRDDGQEVSDAEWERRKLNYVGRRTISQYGCFGCHDIPGFETARPIGTALQDWGRKDTSKLAPEHIEEFLAHHGEPDGSSTKARVVDALRRADDGTFKSNEDEERELAAAFFYESLLHHGRPGFFWQKLRQPRSYDYEKIETKPYTDRLRMPKFPFDEGQIEAIATFVLGLVAEPPPEQYLYQPTGPARDRIEGERLLTKFNCGGCHLIDMPKIRYAANPDDLLASELSAGDHPEGYELLLKLKPPRQGETGETVELEIDGERVTRPIISFEGLISNRPDPQDLPEDQEFAYDLWETLQVGEKQLLTGSKMLASAASLVDAAGNRDGYARPARGGEFAEWLAEHMMDSTTIGTTRGDRSLARQMAPPPLYLEGLKVQTPWLYRFLLEPGQIRHTTLLRMPQFNMSSEEAMALANYFPAVDGVEYPYQQIPQREPQYLSLKNRELHQEFPQAEGDYLANCWKTLNVPLCIKCHSLGGRQVKVSDPKKDIRGPNLDLAADRLRPEWALLWLYKPAWITPYTSMPANLPRDQKQFEDLFGGDAGLQTKAIRDALLNYNSLMEREGKFIYEPKVETAQAVKSE